MAEDLKPCEDCGRIRRFVRLTLDYYLCPDCANKARREQAQDDEQTAKRNGGAYRFRASGGC
jgi:hypothetical protein